MSFQSTQNLELSSNVTKQLCFEELIYREMEYDMYVLRKANIKL